jgi:hypothetical protein
MEKRCGRTPALQVRRSPEFKPQSHIKKKKNLQAEAGRSTGDVLR